MSWLTLVIFFAAGGVVALGFAVFVSLNERRLAARAAADWRPDATAATARDAIWSATLDPADCPHDDVLEDRSERLDTWYGGIQPAVPKIFDQGGVCHQCGARVIRHGSPYAWSKWMIDPTEPDAG